MGKMKNQSTSTTQEFPEVFEELRKILRKYEKRLVVKNDEPGNYYLDTPFKRDDGYAFSFGAVQIKKNYVSYHLMPLYMSAALQGRLSPELKARMQGKACFNFKKVDRSLFKELAQVTRAAFEGFQKFGYI
jgi:hypothetical protein